MRGRLEADHWTSLCSRPLHFAWDKAFPDAQGYCIDEDKFFKGSGSVNVVLNFVVFLLVSESILYSVFDHHWHFLAHTAPMATSNHLKAKDHSDVHLYTRWLVCQRGLVLLGPNRCWLRCSVVLVSIIWIVVLSSLSHPDPTCKSTKIISIIIHTHYEVGNFINAGLWSAIEPNMVWIITLIRSWKSGLMIV